MKRDMNEQEIRVWVSHCFTKNKMKIVDGSQRLMFDLLGQYKREKKGHGTKWLISLVYLERSRGE